MPHTIKVAPLGALYGKGEDTMSLATTFGVLGGDRRQLYLAQSLAGDGYPVYTSCLGDGSPPGCLATLSGVFPRGM